LERQHLAGKLRQDSEEKFTGIKGMNRDIKTKKVFIAVYLLNPCKFSLYFICLKFPLI
jgi:hypothetical protein